MGQGVSLHDCVSCSAGHVKPPCRACVTTDRLRVRVPLEQDLVHAVQLLHVATSQCTGQGPSVQLCVSLSEGHAIPPFCTAVVMDLARVCVPPVPHVRLQSLNVPHPETAQSTAHACELHVALCSKTWQVAPPCAAAVTTLRLRL